MKELNEKILKNFRDNIAISNLKEEFIMKRAMKKQVITLSIIGIVFLSGGFLTVNASTGGELINNIKEVLFGKANESIDVEIKEDTFNVENYETDENGNITNSTYTFEDENGYMYKIEDIKE